MNALRYMNSRDIAEHLRSISFEFNAMQAAYIIYINEWLTIRERISLWKEIIDTMPDCEFQYASNYSVHMEPSAHAAIRAHIEQVEDDLSAFLDVDADSNQHVFIPLASRWKKRPEWILPSSAEREAIGGAVWNKCTHATPFSSFEKCVQYLKRESKKHERSVELLGKFEPFDRHRIGKTMLDDESEDCYQMNPLPEPLDYCREMVTLDGNFEPIGITMNWGDSVFEHVVPEIPHPFEGGDILIDAAKRTSLPFVFDRCVTWTLLDEPEPRKRKALFHASSKEGSATDDSCLERSKDLRECNLALDDRCSTMGACCFAHGDMCAYGYELDDADEKDLLKYSWAGACDNYLNLEYFIGPFDGKLAVLPTVSWFVINEDRNDLDCSARANIEHNAQGKFESRGIENPNAAPYDICALVNAGFKLG